MLSLKPSEDKTISHKSLKAVFLVGNETNMIKYTLNNIHRIMNKLNIYEYCTFSTINNEDNIFANFYTLTSDLLDIKTQFYMCQKLLEECEAKHLVKFHKIFIIDTNSVILNTMEISNLIQSDNCLYITTVKNLEEEIDLGPSTHYLDSITLCSEKYYELNVTGEVFNIENVQIPQEYLSSLFDNVFHYDKLQCNVDGKIIFFITSVVNVLNHDSKWTSCERLEQVVESLKSIKKYIPDAVTFLLEGSILNINQIEELSQHTDFLVLFNDDAYKGHVNFINKSNFEIHGFIYLLDRLKNFKWFCKLGGRYRITGDFDRERFFTSTPTFFYNDIMYNNNYVHPVLYSVPYSYVYSYIEHLNEMNVNYHNIEYILYCYAYRKLMEESTNNVNIINDNGKIWAIGYMAANLKLIKKVTS